ncbi:MAG: hypothetical protein JXR14_02450 [Paracoccaceae bacterium]
MRADESSAYYYALQAEARTRVMNSLNKRLLKSGGIKRWDNLTLCSILGSKPGDALKFASEEWPRHYPDGYHGLAQDWTTLAIKSINDTDHFNLAIWQKIDGVQNLVALALGNPSNSRKFLTIKWVERFQGPNPLAGRALWPILVCAEEYAKLLGSDKVLIKDPVDPSKYERYGYEVYLHPNVKFGGNYLGKDVTDG